MRVAVLCAGFSCAGGKRIVEKYRVAKNKRCGRIQKEEENPMPEKLISLYNWFDIERDELIKGHEGQWVLVADNSALGYFNDQSEATLSAEQRGLKVGEFLAQYCIPREQEYNMFYSVNRGLSYV